MRSSPSAWLSAGVRVALVGVLLIWAARPDLPQFEGKAMAFRAGIYPVLAAVLPALWWWRGRPRPYPHVADALLVLPLLTDTAGNAADLFRFVEFGWAIHFTSMAMITAGLGMLLVPRGLGRGATAMLVLGVGAILHTIWEIFEWIGVYALGLALDVRYVTTMGDFAAGLGGSTLGALVTAWVAWPRPSLGGTLFARRRAAPPPQRGATERVPAGRVGG